MGPGTLIEWAFQGPAFRIISAIAEWEIFPLKAGSIEAARLIIFAIAEWEIFPLKEKGVLQPI